jgi:ParB/RepB/Spo0J family partition protein
MNAPATAAQLAAPKVELLALTAIAPSETHIQVLRRQRFTKDELKDLADSITKTRGVLQPIVVRPLAAPRGTAKYEIVAGERRWLASKVAGFAQIQATIRELGDEEILEFQLIENLQRKDLHALEEAEGYDELMKLKKITAEQLVEVLAKSRSFVYARLKLLALCPEARKAFYAGELDASKALLIARIGHHDTQRQAMKAVTAGEYGRGPMSYREAHEYILRNFMLKLATAPFDIKDAALVPKAGDCIKCPKRTGNQADLFGDVKSADVCTDPKCFEAKRDAHMAAELKALEAKGKKVIHGAEARKIFPHWENGSDWMQGGYTEISQTTWAGGKNQKIADLLGKDFEPTLIQHPGTGKVLKVATQQQIAAAASKGKKVGHSSTPHTSPARSSGGDYEMREKVALRIAGELVKKHPGTLSHAELVYLVDREHESWEAADDSLYKAFKLTPGASPAKLNDKDLVRFVIAGAITEGLINGYGNATKFASDICKRFKLDPKKVRKTLEAEAKAAKASLAKSKPKSAKETEWPFPTGKRAPVTPPKKAKAKKK